MEEVRSIEPYVQGAWLGGRYEIQRKLGQGGFAFVYLVYDHKEDRVYAFKVLRPEVGRRAAVRNRFRREAQVWLELGTHPFLVKAHFVDVVKGQWVLAIDYVAPDARGCISLGDHLQAGPLPLDISLRWAIQCCYGLSFAYQQGLKSHRDIKPANILVDQGQTVKITDLGLARGLGADDAFVDIDLGTMADTSDLEVVTQGGQRMGTPTHMSPEQFTDPAGCDEVSDIYSFGVVLYEMATGGSLPFSTKPPTVRSPEALQAYVGRLEAQHVAGPVPTLPEPWGRIVTRCLQKERSRRYASFEALRLDLEALLVEVGGRRVTAPNPEQPGPQRMVERGYSFCRLRDYRKALQAFDEAIGGDPGLAAAWSGKGMALLALGRTVEALAALDRAVKLAPEHTDVHLHRGEALARLRRYDEALRAYEAALERDWRHLAALSNKGQAHFDLQHYEEALLCFDMASAIDPDQPGYQYNKGVVLQERGDHAQAEEAWRAAVQAAQAWSGGWIGLGFAALANGQLSEARDHLARALKRAGPQAEAWLGKGYILAMEGGYQEALDCFLRAIEEEPQYAGAWINSGIMHYKLQKQVQAHRALNAASQIAPTDGLAWYNQGTLRLLTGDPSRAVPALCRACDQLPDVAPAFYNLGLALHTLGSWEEAETAYRRALALDWHPPMLWYNLGVCRAAQGARADAVTWLEKVVHAGDDPEADGILARCQAQGAVAHRTDVAALTLWSPRTRPMPGLRLCRRLVPLSYRTFPSA